MTDGFTHISRGNLPWRPAALTECGLSLANHTAMSREEFQNKFKREGQARCALTTCMTCWQAFERWVRSEASSPLVGLGREIDHCRWKDRHPDDHRRLTVELLAIGVLVDRHHEEFDALCAEHCLQDENDLAKKRKSRSFRRNDPW